jgi:hypothetical protein
MGTTHLYWDGAVPDIANVDFSMRALAYRHGFQRDYERQVPLANFYPRLRMRCPTGFGLLRQRIADVDIHHFTTQSKAISFILAGMSGTRYDVTAPVPAMDAHGNYFPYARNGPAPDWAFARTRVAQLAILMRSAGDYAAIENSLTPFEVAHSQGSLVYGNRVLDSLPNLMLLSRRLYQADPELKKHVLTSYVLRLRGRGIASTLATYYARGEAELVWPTNPKFYLNQGEDDEIRDMGCIYWATMHPAMQSILSPSNDPILGIFNGETNWFAASATQSGEPWANFAVGKDMERTSLLGTMRHMALLAGKLLITKAYTTVNVRVNDKQDVDFQFLTKLLERNTRLSDTLPYLNTMGMDALWMTNVPMDVISYGIGTGNTDPADIHRTFSLSFDRAIFASAVNWEPMATPAFKMIPGMHVGMGGRMEYAFAANERALDLGRKAPHIRRRWQYVGCEDCVNVDNALPPLTDFANKQETFHTKFSKRVRSFRAPYNVDRVMHGGNYRKITRAPFSLAVNGGVEVQNGYIPPMGGIDLPTSIMFDNFVEAGRDYFAVTESNRLWHRLMEVVVPYQREFHFQLITNQTFLPMGNVLNLGVDLDAPVNDITIRVRKRANKRGRMLGGKQAMSEAQMAADLIAIPNSAQPVGEAAGPVAAAVASGKNLDGLRNGVGSETLLADMVNPESAKVQRELAEAVERSDRLEKELVECQEQIKALNEKAAAPAGTGHPTGFSSTEVTQIANAMLDMKLALEAEYSAKLADEVARLKAGSAPPGGEGTGSDSGETQAKNA